MYAGIDCGTQSTKVVIYDEHKGVVIARGQAEHQLDSREDGTREQHPNDWLEALKRAFARALSSGRVDPKSIDAIGVSGQQHGLVVLDAADQVIRPAKLWCDTSTWRENAQLIDSPGVWEYGLWRLEEQEIGNGFREFSPYLGHCKFNNCLHASEPGCAIKEAVEKGLIRDWRYRSYLRLLEQNRTHEEA